mgnify:CR=1 FL=1
MEINADYVIRRTILFDNKCGFVLGENPKAPNPYVTWQFNEQDGHRDYFWGHYHNEPGMAERDLHNRAEDYQRRYHVQEVEQAPDKETYKYYSTQRPIDIGTYPKSYFNRPIHMDIYFTRQQVPGEAFQAWGAITYAQPLTDREMRELRSLRRPRRRMRRRDGSTARRAGGTQRMPQRTTSTAGQISTETSTILIPMVTWRPAGKRSAEKAVTLMTRVFTSQTATAR